MHTLRDVSGSLAAASPDEWTPRNASTALGKEEVRLRDAGLAAASNGVVIVDLRAPDQAICFVNVGFQLMTGYPAEEVLGRSCRFLQGAETDPAAASQFRDVMRAGESATILVRNHRRDGTLFWNEVTLSVTAPPPASRAGAQAAPRPGRPLSLALDGPARH